MMLRWKDSKSKRLREVFVDLTAILAGSSVDRREDARVLQRSPADARENHLTVSPEVLFRQGDDSAGNRERL